MVVFFILLMLVVQVAFLVVARNATATAVDASVRRVATSPANLAEERVRLTRDVHATVPGVTDLHVVLEREGLVVRGGVSFDWQPPGPDLLPVSVTVERQANVVVAP